LTKPTVKGSTTTFDYSYGKPLIGDRADDHRKLERHPACDHHVAKPHLGQREPTKPLELRSFTGRAAVAVDLVD